MQGNKEGKDVVVSAKASSSSATSNAKSANNAASSTDASAKSSHCFCGVVSLLECVAGGGGGGGGAQPSADRTTKRALRSKHREFNTRARVAWGARSAGGGASKRQRGKSAAGPGTTTSSRRCHQPRHLPLPLNPNTRVAFAYELTSIAIILDASPSLTSTFGIQSMMCDFSMFGEEKINASQIDDTCCVPLDRLGTLMKKYLQGLVQPIEVPVSLMTL